MARLDLDEKGGSFLDLKLIRSSRGTGAVICLHIPAARGRSTMVLYDKVWWGDDEKAIRTFMKKITSRRPLKWIWELTEKIGFVSIRWPGGSANARFSAVWRDECGLIEYRRPIPTENMRRFRESIGALGRCLSS